MELQQRKAMHNNEKHNIISRTTQHKSVALLLLCNPMKNYKQVEVICEEILAEQPYKLPDCITIVFKHSHYFETDA